MEMLSSSVTSVQTVVVNLQRALVLPDFDGFKRKPLSIYMATMTKYEDGLPTHIVYEKDTLSETLGEVLSAGGYRQLRIAETEKYAHVTYFLQWR